MVPESNVPFPVPDLYRDTGGMRGQPDVGDMNGVYGGSRDFASNGSIDTPGRARSHSQRIADELRFSNPDLRGTRRQQEDVRLLPYFLPLV